MHSQAVGFQCPVGACCTCTAADCIWLHARVRPFAKANVAQQQFAGSRAQWGQNGVSYILLGPRSFNGAAKVILGWFFAGPAALAAGTAVDAAPAAWLAFGQVADCVAVPSHHSLQTGEQQATVACLKQRVQPAVCRVCRIFASAYAFCE